MLEPVAEEEMLEPDVSHLVTEDDSPVDGWFQMKQLQLLTDVLEASWPEGRPFVVGSDVGLFYAVKPAIVPDVLLSVGVDYPEDFKEKNRRSYFTWVFGKPPEVVIEVVSNKEGEEDTSKLETYTSIRVPYYAIYDPLGYLSSRPLRIFQLSGASYVEKVDRFFPEVGLGLTIWEGEFAGLRDVWLRWTDAEGHLLATGPERAAKAEARAAETEARVEQEKQRREALERKLRELGIDPEEV